MVEYKPMNSDKGCLIGICPTCENIMNRFSNIATLSAIEDILEVTIRE
jgi:succinate dehydrogenase/fumarate reductase-like Fe-S protein